MNEQYEFEIASTKKRAGAFIIDDMVMALFIFVIFYDQIINITTAEALNAFSANNLTLIVAIKILYHTFFVWQNGKTLGKQLMRIKVIELHRASHPTLPTALFRASIRIVSEMLFYIGFILAFFSPMVQTLHDKLSRCVVVDER
ncbi:MAG: RDD family protein [Campylobacterota bacterium]|nr:RDD family protein [Campylobacterota bacterium]